MIPYPLRIGAPAVLLALVLVLAPAPAARAADEFVLPELALETYTLSNGLHVILHEDHRLPTVSVNVWYHVGSKDEKPGRTGFAHLFEHMMFQGSAHHDDDYFTPLQKIGGQVNGSTNTDRTNYWQNVPADQVELALQLEADRMGWLLPAMTQEKLDNQRDVVKNEKRQGENRPYAVAREALQRLLFPEGHPYRWTTIGSMDDLSAASLEDVQDFFRLHYTPNNASLCVAGDFDPARVKEWVAAYFGPIPPGRPLERLTEWVPTLAGERRAVAEDAVDTPRLYMAWHTPGYYAPGDAEFDLLGAILAGGKTSRLHRRLVLELQIAQDVRARQRSRELGGVFEIEATAAPGHDIAELEAVIDEELERLLDKGVTGEEVELARTGIETDFVRDLQEVGGFGGRADRLNRYHVFAGRADYLAADLARYRNAYAGAVGAWARRCLGRDNRAVLHVVPRGDLAAMPEPAGLDRTRLAGSAGAAAFVPPSIGEAVLENGLKVWTIPDPSLPLVQFRLEIRSGWASDPAGRAGTAALTADLLDEGAGGRDALDLARDAERLGARLRTTSSFDGSSVAIEVLANRARDGLELLRDVALEPDFPVEDFERVRRARLARVRQEARRPRDQAVKAFQERCFGAGHPYAQPYTGSGDPEALAALDVADLAAFHAAHYTADNAVLVVAGALDGETALALARDVFGRWAPGERPAPDVPAAAPAAAGSILVLDRPGAAQSFIVGGFPAVARRDADYTALDVVNTAFGGQFGSRINMNLREDKGYTYGVRSQLLALGGGGAFLMSTPVETGVTVAAMRELVAEMDSLRTARPLRGDELADNRNRLVMGFPQRFETRSDVAAAAGELALYGLPRDTWQDFAAAVAGVDEAVAAAAVARHLDPARLIWVVVGDAAVIGPELEAAGLGRVEIAGSGTK
ncbi:insulinase family protein [bacterium]|nr:insulinase family protein [bacterium]